MTMDAHISFLRSEDFDSSLTSAELFSIGWNSKEILKSLKHGSSGFKATVEGEIVGYSLFRELSDEIEILDFAIKSEWRSKGFARQLLTGLFELGESRNISSIWLEVRESNYPAIALYMSLGFDLKATRKDYYSIKSKGSQEKLKEDALILKRKVGPL
jgi:ribosomal-protein-alanine N-acetyltransferase